MKRKQTRAFIDAAVVTSVTVVNILQTFYLINRISIVCLGAAEQIAIVKQLAMIKKNFICLFI